MSQENISRSPEWQISALNKQTEERGNIGVGWNNADESISIRFNMLVSIPIGAKENLVITLFPKNSKKKEENDYSVKPADSTQYA